MRRDCSVADICGWCDQYVDNVCTDRELSAAYGSLGDFAAMCSCALVRWLLRVVTGAPYQFPTKSEKVVLNLGGFSPRKRRGPRMVALLFCGYWWQQTLGLLDWDHGYRTRKHGKGHLPPEKNAKIGKTDMILYKQATIGLQTQRQ